MSTAPTPPYDVNPDLDELVKKLRDAAEEVEKLKGKPHEEIERSVAELQSCCGDCTLISPIPPCRKACIYISPLW